MNNQISTVFEIDDAKKMERICIEAIKTSPWYADAWLALGRSLHLQGYGEQAKQALRRACLLAPRAAWIHDIQKLLPTIPDGQRRPYLDKLFSVKNVSVSAALIVKNEIRCIARCLNSIVNAVDEIVIVDTGSTDGTVEYIKTFQQQYPQTKLIHFAWCDDFAAARNAAFPYITSEWVLWVDADEYLSVEEAPSIKEAAGLFDTFPEPVILTLGNVNHTTTVSGKNSMPLLILSDDCFL
ncbi:glycosyltransferase family 2 protein [Aneurinibacillus danicus]|uniref:Glycosyltransferase 2-like domain-containing protein n=1 Tax=Aneurinibacillus danicus TaxID=267746 RepID=A0A511VBV5_9BACL|nr:glycosyltransferase family 2 protein [Aneurinibacillus danicus]GEN35033.1 hypothetical protein ADA01nite_24930 [Aneurinibacillus danicus]